MRILSPDDAIKVAQTFLMVNGITGDVLYDDQDRTVQIAFPLESDRDVTFAEWFDQNLIPQLERVMSGWYDAGVSAGMDMLWHYFAMHGDTAPRINDDFLNIRRE